MWLYLEKPLDKDNFVNSVHRVGSIQAKKSNTVDTCTTSPSFYPLELPVGARCLTVYSPTTFQFRLSQKSASYFSLSAGYCAQGQKGKKFTVLMFLCLAGFPCSIECQFLPISHQLSHVSERRSCFSRSTELLSVSSVFTGDRVTLYF